MLARLGAPSRVIFLSKLFSSKKFLQTGSWFFLLEKHHSAFRSLTKVMQITFSGFPKMLRLFCAPSRDRTYDLRIKSPMLYQLSYRGIDITCILYHIIYFFSRVFCFFMLEYILCLYIRRGGEGVQRCGLQNRHSWVQIPPASPVTM